MIKLVEAFYKSILTNCNVFVKFVGDKEKCNFLLLLIKKAKYIVVFLFEKLILLQVKIFFVTLEMDDLILYATWIF